MLDYWNVLQVGNFRSFGFNLQPPTSNLQLLNDFSTFGFNLQHCNTVRKKALHWKTFQNNLF